MTQTRFVDWSDQEVLEELDELGEGLTAWEIDFVESLTGVDELTDEQSEKLREIATERIPW